MRAHSKGVTLVELLTVMVIISILTAIAVPGYRNYMIRTNRTEAKVGLLQVASALERCFTRFSSYLAADGCVAEDALNLPFTTADGNYVIDRDVPNGDITRTTFALVAVPQAGQADDVACANFMVDQRDQRDVTGPRGAQDCWGR